jgi:glucokinase
VSTGSTVRGRLAAGLDLGGTKIAGVLLDEEGRVRSRTVGGSPAGDPAALREALFGVLEDLRRGGEPVAVGVGVAGLVDQASGTLWYAPNIAWREVRIRDLVADRTGLPCVVDNDANAAAVGEARYGSGRGYTHLLIVTVGTGIGGGIVIDRALYRGAHGFAAEIGHVVVEPGGPRCGCGNLGCWEQMASGQALARLAREEVEAHPEGVIAKAAAGGPPEGVHVTVAAAGGDPPARRIVAEVGRRLGEGLAGLANVLDPQAIVVGGGVAEIGDPLLGPAREAFLAMLEAPAHRPDVPLLPAALGNDAGAVGAASLALELAP